MNTPISFKDLTLNAVQSTLTGLGYPRFRTAQLIKWVYQNRLDSFDDMHNISKADRIKLAGIFNLKKLPVLQTMESTHHDAVKFGFGLQDVSDTVESVLLYSDKRRTACLSSQLGCGLKCTFCATGTMGFIRNLTRGEIIGQLVGINDYLSSHNDTQVDHIVFMGMGEALSNFETFCSCCEIIRSDNCLAMSGRRITVSTAGVIPSIDRLTRQGPKVNLAISLNAAFDEYRSQIMPINRTYPIKDLIAAGNRFAVSTGMDLTFEYVINHGVNDRPQDVSALVTHLSGIPCKINCIPLNRNPNQTGTIPPPDHVQRFSEALYQKGIVSTVRKSRGDDICGACGQLRSRLSTDTLP